MAAAQALRAHGHEVAFLSGERARGTVERHSFPFLPLRHLDEESIYRACFSSCSRSLRGKAAVLREWLLLSLPGQVEDQQAAIAAWRPDVVLCDVTVWGPPLILHERMQLPVAICSFAPGCMIPSPSVPPWGLGLPSPRRWPAKLLTRAALMLTQAAVSEFRKTADEMRTRFGLRPLGMPVHQYLAQMPLYLVPSVRELDFERNDTPPNVHYIGPLIWNDTTASPTPDWMLSLPRTRPWVHVSEGTMHVYEPFLLKAAAEGLGDLPMEVIMTTGGTRDADVVPRSALKPNVRLERWVPHTELFPRTDVVVTTGGAGTVLTALQAGIPLVIIPTEWDKADNAQRVVEAGAAIRLSPRKCSPQRLRRCVETVLNEPFYKRNAKRLAAILDRCNGPERLAVLMEQTFRPVIRPASVSA
jgi:MGT family glycosyltransferase